ncbi:MAG TPA: MATE family efflux transporter [Actinomycetales bacterium]|nr:MATE family efflux transporter [Actinomycetales bacterium]
MDKPVEIGTGDKSLTKQVLALAVPALGALVAEPVFVLIDSAVVGRLGANELAGLALASAILMTAVGLNVYLAYATTAAVARHIGAGNRQAALSLGIGGLWLALILGAALAALGMIFAEPLLNVLNANAHIMPHAKAYLLWSLPGLPGMLLVLAATGVLRGLLDTRTPLVVAVLGAIFNAAMSIILVHPVGMGVGGSGAATALTQILMGIALGVVVLRHARAAHASWRPQMAGILLNFKSGVPLFIRTLSLRAAFLLTVFVATNLGAITLAGHQVVNAWWGFLAFALDALAIAAQALVGQMLGSGNNVGARELTQRLARWGIWLGIVLGLVTALAAPFITPLFTADPAVQEAVAWGLVVAGAVTGIGGYVFVLDGVLIGAGDGVYLARVGLLTLATFLPMIALVYFFAPGGTAGLVWVWVAFGGGYMAARAVANGVRAHGDKWLKVGAALDVE